MIFFRLASLGTGSSPDANSYLRFVVSGLDGPITNATLRLYVQDSSSIGFDVRSVANNSWGEMSLTYNNAPPIGAAIGASGPITITNWVAVDVTTTINGAGTYSLALTSNDTNGIVFDSREGVNAPQLVIETGGNTPTPTPTATDTAIPTPTNTPRPPKATSTPGPTIIFMT